MVYADLNNDGTINPATEILEENNYYPFGLKHKGYNDLADYSATNKYKYSYGGKELNDELGLDLYDFGARNYDAAIGRWLNVDPLAENYIGFSPYHFSGNNPINYRDVDGRYYVGTNGKKVNFTQGKDGTIKVGKNASAELRRLVNSVNSSGSKTAIAQIMTASQNESKIHVKITKEKIDNGLLGVHQAHDKDGNMLKWDDEKGDFNGTPAYVNGKDGVYSEATITIFEGNIEESGGNGDFYGFNVTIDQEIANTFQHESNHNTDSEFIKDLKNKRDGKPYKGIDSHQNIDEQEQKVYREMHDNNKKE